MPFNDWELDTVQHFIGTINNKKVNLLEKENLSWKIDGKGSFTIKANFIKAFFGLFGRKEIGLFFMIPPFLLIG